MVRIDDTEETLGLIAGPIRLAFQFDGCRWSHYLAVGERVLASSVEWLPERDAPTRVVSPAYQQVSRQTGSAGDQALLLGQWGHHHFSGVFTAREEGGTCRSRSTSPCGAEPISNPSARPTVFLSARRTCGRPDRKELSGTSSVRAEAASSSRPLRPSRARPRRPFRSRKPADPALTYKPWHPLNPRTPRTGWRIAGDGWPRMVERFS